MTWFDKEESPFESLKHKARFHEHHRDYELAVACYSEAIALAPKDGELWASRALTKGMMNDFQGEASDFATAIELNPDKVEHRSERAWATFQSGELEAGVRELDRVVEAFPVHSAAWRYRSIAKSRQGDLAGALADADKSVEADSMDIGAWHWRGVVHYISGDAERALSDFQRQTGGGAVDAWVYGALFAWMAELRTDHKDRAKRQLGVWLRSSGTMDEYCEWQHALVAFAIGELTRKQVFDRVERAPKWDRGSRECEAHFYTGIAALSAGDTALALADFREAVASHHVELLEWDLACYELKRLEKR